MRKSWIPLLFTILILPGCAGLNNGRPSSRDVNRLTAEELKAALGSPGLVVIDVREDWDWRDSKLMIPGADHRNSRRVADWAPEYAKNDRLVLYCA